MSLLDGIGKAFKSIGTDLLKTAQSVIKSPFGLTLFQAGLSALKGGMPPLLGAGISLLSQLPGVKLLGAFHSFAAQFLGAPQSFLSPQCLGALAPSSGARRTPRSCSPCCRTSSARSTMLLHRSPPPTTSSSTT